MNISEIYSEYLFLNKEEVLKYKLPRTFEDLWIKDLIILRRVDGYYEIIYLYSDISLIFQEDYLDIIYSFEELPENINPKNSLDQFILNLIQISKIISRKLICNEGQKLLDLIKNNCSIGTKSFRDLIKEYLDIELEPWKLKNKKY